MLLNVLFMLQKFIAQELLEVTAGIAQARHAIHHIAGQGWADWLFMLGLLGIGVALVLGFGVRIAAVAGVVLVAMMWAAVWPLAQHASDGSLTGSTNPFVDEHMMDALALIVIGVAGAGSRLGLGALWARLPFVQRHPVLL